MPFRILMQICLKWKSLPSGLTLLSLLVGWNNNGCWNVIVATKCARFYFSKYYAPTLPQDTAKNFGKIIYFGIIIAISFFIFSSSQGC